MATNSLQRMIALEGNFKQLVFEAREFLTHVQKRPADDEVITPVRVADIHRALEFYLNCAITEEQLREWADVLEMCDCVNYESGKEEIVSNMLFRLSTPEINESITRSLAQKLRDELREL